MMQPPAVSGYPTNMMQPDPYGSLSRAQSVIPGQYSQAPNQPIPEYGGLQRAHSSYHSSGNNFLGNPNNFGVSGNFGDPNNFGNPPIPEYVQTNTNPPSSVIPGQYGQFGNPPQSQPVIPDPYGRGQQPNQVSVIPEFGLPQIPEYGQTNPPSSVIPGQYGQFGNPPQSPPVIPDPYGTLQRANSMPYLSQNNSYSNMYSTQTPQSSNNFGPPIHTQSQMPGYGAYNQGNY